MNKYCTMENKGSNRMHTHTSAWKSESIQREEQYDKRERYPENWRSKTTVMMRQT